MKHHEHRSTFEEQLMSLSNVPVTSREYKLILNSDRFQNFEAGEGAFWHLVEFLVSKNGGEIVERQKEVKLRKTWYLDTPNFSLKRQGWIVRLRKEKKKFKLTLKARNSDRYISAGLDLSTLQNAKECKTKFEEDILPKFSSKFAHSTSIKFKQQPKIKSFAHLAELFPVLSELQVSQKTRLQVVNEFIAYESAHWSGKAKIGNGHTIKACISTWYPTKDRNGIPLITEFSFDYDLFESNDKIQRFEQLEQFDTSTVNVAAQIFQSLQKQNGWIRFHATTKTEFAYEAF